MAQTDSILSTILFLIVAMIILAVCFLGFSKYQELSYKADLSKFQYEKDLSKFETSLIATETYSRKNFIEMITLAFENNKTINTIYGKVHINESLKREYDYFFGEDNYFLEIKPQVQELRLIFLYDQGSIMQMINKKENFTNIIQSIKSNFSEEKFNITFKVYILDKTNPDACLEFDKDGIECEMWGIDELYNIEDSEIFTDPVKLLKGEWSLERPDGDYQTYVYYSNDWGTFLGHVSFKNSEFAKLYTKKGIIVLFTDAMSLGGASDRFFTTTQYKFYKSTYPECISDFQLAWQYLLSEDEDYIACADECLETYWEEDMKAEFYKCRGDAISEDIVSCIDTLKTTDEYKEVEDNYIECVTIRNEKSANLSAGYYLHKYYCEPNTNFALSNFTVNRIIPTIKENKHFIFPVIVRNDNVAETEIERGYMMQYYENVSYNLGEDTGKEETICGKINCKGCVENATASIFHNETRENHVAQAKKVATTGRGSVVMYDEDSDLFTIVYNIVADMATRDIIQIGKKRENLYKQVFKRQQTVMMEGEVVALNIYLETYPDLEYQFNGTMNFIPLVNNFTKSDVQTEIIISHNKQIFNLTLSDKDCEDEFETIKIIEDVLYKYKFICGSVPQTIDDYVMSYTDINGEHNLSITKFVKI